MRDGELVGTGTCSDGVGVPGVGVDWAVPRGLAEDGLGARERAAPACVNESEGWWWRDSDAVEQWMNPMFYFDP